MATEVSGQGGQRAIGHEEYSLYSSLSEDELLQMAVEQSLADKTRGPAPEAVGAHLHPRTRSRFSEGRGEQEAGTCCRGCRVHSCRRFGPVACAAIAQAQDAPGLPTPGCDLGS